MRQTRTRATVACVTTVEPPRWGDVTLYLGHPHVATPRDMIRRPEELIPAALRPDTGIHGELYFLPPSSDEPPAWVRPLTSLTAEVPLLTAANPGAVLLFRSAERWFAAAFGRGHLRLQAGMLVDDFGLRVAANRLDPDGVVSVDSRAVEQTVFLNRRQASRGTGLGTLGVESDRESIHALTGRPRDTDFGRRVTGRAGFHLTRPVAPEELPVLAADLLIAYEAHDYEAAFSMLDRQRAVIDPTLIAELDDLLVGGLAQPERGGAYLAPPEIVDWANVAGFRFSGDPRGVRRVDVSFDDYAALVENDIRLDRLHEDRLSLITRDTDRRIPWPVYRCLIAERQTEDGVYVLSDGRWWRIHPDFIAEIDGIVASVPEAQVPLPPYLATDASETEYNTRAAAGIEGAVALDADLARVRGERGPIELCDIAGPGLRLIHVKRGVRAEKLSHLFAQAVGSAEALRHLPEIRAQLRARLEPSLPVVAAQIADERMNPQAWEVVIAIVAPLARVPRGLPFFSRAHLARAVRTLRRLDYQVAYRGIEPP